VSARQPRLLYNKQIKLHTWRLAVKAGSQWAASHAPHRCCGVLILQPCLVAVSFTWAHQQVALMCYLLRYQSPLGGHIKCDGAQQECCIHCSMCGDGLHVFECEQSDVSTCLASIGSKADGLSNSRAAAAAAAHPCTMHYICRMCNYLLSTRHFGAATHLKHAAQCYLNLDAPASCPICLL
jgi:hypothetical protein